MNPNQLHVFTARFNPIGWQAPHNHYKAWAQHMLESGVQVHVIELQYGEQEHVCHHQCHASGRAVHHIRVTAESWAWSKENLLNLAIARVPEAQYIAWIDSDVFFRNSGWASQTLKALQHYRVVQPWKTALDMGPNGELLQTHTSFCERYMQGGPLVPEGDRWWKFAGGPYEYPHPGFAWASTREFLDRVGGLVEVGGMGSGDHHMALGLVGKVHRSWPGKTTASYQRILNLWQQRAMAYVNGRIGVVHGVIEHQFHGPKQSRQYNGRWDMFLRHGFDPDYDLKRNSHGVVEFAGNKPCLEREWDLYLRGRNEDANCNIY